MGYKDEMLNKLIMFLAGIVVISIVVRGVVDSGFFVPKVYKGKGYIFDIPEGWKKSEELSGVTRSEDGQTETETVVYLAPENNVLTGVPVAMISVVAITSPRAIWIEDEFGEILRYIQGSGYRILDTGARKVDTAYARWVLFIDRTDTWMTLEYYFVPESGVLHKMVYSAYADSFKKYVRNFEKVRKSFKFFFSLF